MECSICYCKLTIDNILRSKCNHLFCGNCFWKWTEEHNNCPMCRAKIIKENENLKAEEDNIRNNIFQLMERETTLYTTITGLENDLYELEDTLFEIDTFKKKPEAYMKKYMEKRDKRLLDIEKKSKTQMDDVLSQLKTYNTFYDNNEQIFLQIKFEKENMELDRELSEMDWDNLLVRLDTTGEIYNTPSPRSALQSPPPIIRNNRTRIVHI